MSVRLERGVPVLVDANVIIESHRTGVWRALAGGYRLETVEDCVAETQTGFQLRREEQLIAVGELRASLLGEHAVSVRQRAELAVRIDGIALDRGEESLWAHALERDDGWVICGPDRASLRCGIRLGYRDRIVSLQQLLDVVGYRANTTLRRHYTTRWQQAALTELLLAERDWAQRAEGVRR